MANFFNMTVKSMFKQLKINVNSVFGSSEYSSKGLPGEDYFKDIVCKSFEEQLQKIDITEMHLYLCDELMASFKYERNVINLDNLPLSNWDREIESKSSARINSLYDQILKDKSKKQIAPQGIRKFFYLAFQYAYRIVKLTPKELKDKGKVKNIIEKITQQKIEDSINARRVSKQKKPSPKLDEKTRKELENIGIAIETEGELYSLMMNFALQLLEEGTDDNFAFSLLADLYEIHDLQDNICGFAIMLYENEDYERAFKIFWGLAKQEHDVAQMYVGDCYHYGKGVKENLGIAYNWYSKVADLKDNGTASIAQTGLVMCLLGMAHTEDSDFLLQLFISTAHKYAELGNAQVQYILACAYRNGKGVPVDDTLAHFWMGEAARNGLMDAIKIIKEEEN